MIHKYQSNGFNIVLDSDSGAVHLLDGLSYRILDYFTPQAGEKPPKEAYLPGEDPAEIEECWRELRRLYQCGELFCPADENLRNYRTADAPVKSMCLHIAHDCNLRCKYCFAQEGTFGGDRCRMSEETARAAIDFLIEHSGKRHNLELDFFGGEPLLNFDVVKKTVAYARGLEKQHNKLFRFTITTNGVLLDDDKIDFINREMSNVVLSLDGRPEVNDRMRPNAGGQGSYETIVPKFQKLVARREPGKDYYVRGTYTRNNLDFSEDVFHIAGLGFDQISVEPVVVPESVEYSLRQAELPRIFEEYDRLSQRIIQQRKAGGYFNFFHFMIDLNAGPCAIKRVKGCGCGNEYVAVAANGDIYPCHQFVGIADKKMGSVHEPGSFDRKMKAEFADADIFSKPECQNCWAKFYCSGGCNANNFLYCGSIRKPYPISCELEKKRVECAIMIQAALGAGADEEDA